jgi:tetratricopeptide (TPR) repeat protein
MSFERILFAAQGYLELDMPAEALAELDSLDEQDQDREEILQLRLFLLMRGRRWEESVGVCERLRRFWPESLSGFIHGAFCLHELGRTAEARDVLLSGPPDITHEATYFYNLGCYEAVLGNIQKATASLQASFNIDSKFREIAKIDPDLQSVAGLF